MIKRGRHCFEVVGFDVDATLSDTTDCLPFHADCSVVCDSVDTCASAAYRIESLDSVTV